MKLLYLRVFLRTFAIGLAVVWIVAGLRMASDDVNVKLPTASEDVLYVYPDTALPWAKGGGGAGGGRSRFFPASRGCGAGYSQGYFTDDDQSVVEGVRAIFYPKEARRQFLKRVEEADQVIERVPKFRGYPGEVGERVVIQNKPDNEGKESVSIVFYDGGDSYRFIDAPTLALALEFERYLISTDFRSPI